MLDNQKIIINEVSNSLNNKIISDFIGDNELNTKNKSIASNLIKKYIDKESLFGLSVLKKNQIQLKFVPVNENYKCFEALSFPFGSLYNLVFEEWDTDEEFIEAELKKRLKHILVLIPIIKIKVNGMFNDSMLWRVGDLSVWEPTEFELAQIGIEWEQARTIVKHGVKLSREAYGKGFRMKNNLLKQANTKFIHLRPHALNSYDYDKPYKEYTNGNIEVTKQSFWLNKKYLNKLIETYKWKLNSKEE